jgi:uncharacterized protein (TIGR04255 family)
MDIEKSTIKREDLKKNFLLKIILRCDYSGVLESDMDEAMSEITKSLSGYFNGFIEKRGVQTEINPNDVKSSGSEIATIKDLEEIKTYNFSSNKYDMVLTISKKYVWIMPNTAQYIDFSIYSVCLLKVIRILKKHAIYMAITRIGLRKINQLFFKNIDVLHNYFEPNVMSPYQCPKSRNISYEVKDILQVDRYQLTFSRSVRNGRLNNDEVFQVVVDTDINTKNQETISNLIENDHNIYDMNEILFDQYKSSITQSFLVNLTDQSFEDDNIQNGLKSNG